MALTLRAVLDELDRLQAADEDRTIDEIGREEIVESVARAALLGARGNSGVILSQLIRGAAEELVQPPGPADRRDADRRRAGARRRPRLRLGARTGRGHDPDGRPRDGAPDRDRPRAHAGEPAPGPGDPAPAPRTTRSRPRSSARSRPARNRSSAAPRCSRRCATRASSTPAATGSTIIFAGVVAALRGEDPPPLEHHAPGPHHATPSTAPAPTASARTSRSPAAASHAERFTERARSARRLGARGRRREHAEDPSPHRRAGAATACSPARARSRAWTSPTCARRWPSATRAWPPTPCPPLGTVARLSRPLGGRSTSPARRRCAAARRGRQRRRAARAVRGARRAARSTAGRR